MTKQIDPLSNSVHYALVPQDEISNFSRWVYEQNYTTVAVPINEFNNLIYTKNAIEEGFFVVKVNQYGAWN